MASEKPMPRRQAVLVADRRDLTERNTLQPLGKDIVKQPRLVLPGLRAQPFQQDFVLPRSRPASGHHLEELGVQHADPIAECEVELLEVAVLS
eukprot:2881455-Alexandrium_andersonii.AAC.1